jgi:hypothetical protein
MRKVADLLSNLFYQFIFLVLVLNVLNSQIHSITKEDNSNKFRESGRILRAHEFAFFRNDFIPPSISISIGEPPQNFQLALDTVSSLTWVYSSEFNREFVDFGDANSYNVSISQTAEINNLKINEENIIGQVVNDKFSIDEKGLVLNKFPFVSVANLSNPIGGVYSNFPKLGLGYKSGRKEFSILNALKNNNLIKNRIFSFSPNEGNSSFFYLGDYPDSISPTSSAYTFCNVTETDDLDDKFRQGWVCDLSHIFLGDANSFSEAYEIKGRVIFDNLYNYISVPNTYLPYFLKNYFNSSNCQVEADLFEESVFICKSYVYQPLHIMLDGYAYKLELSDLFSVKKSNSTEYYESIFRFKRENDNIWRLGKPFLNKFFTVFNGENSHVGFFGGDKTGFVKEWQDWSNNNWNSIFNQKDKVFYLILGASVLGSILFILIVFIVVHSIKRRRLEEHGPLINENERI